MRLLHGHERRQGYSQWVRALPVSLGKSKAAALSKKVLGILKELDSEQGNGCRNIDCTRWLVACLLFVSLSIFFFLPSAPTTPALL